MSHLYPASLSVFIDKVRDVTCKYNLAKLLSALAKEVKLKLASTFGTSYGTYLVTVCIVNLDSTYFPSSIY